MRYVLIPIFNRLIKPTSILGICVINEEGEFKFHNFNFGMDTPFYRYPKENIEEVFNLYKDNSIICFKKGMYNFPEYKEYYTHWKDLNTILWMYNKEIIDFFYDEKKYIYIPLSLYSKILRDLSSTGYFESLFKVYYPDKIESMLEASSKLDGYIRLDNKKLYKFFDHYTKGSRFRDVLSNTISIETSKRDEIETKGVGVYVDIDSYHLRLIDEILGGYIPKNERGHDWLMRQVFKEGRLPEKNEQKSLTFTAIYSGNFDILPCDWTEMIQMNQYKFKSPLGRKKNPFNYTIQELDVLRMSSYINDLYSEKSEILLYLYDGLYFDIEESYIEEFLYKCKNVIDMPFKVNIKNEEIKINFE